MIAADIINFAVGRIQDSGFSSGDLLSVLNNGVDEISNEIELPYLRSLDTVTTAVDSSSVALPSDYQRRLFWVGSAAQDRKIGSREEDYEDLLGFLAKYPTLDNVGAIEEVCVDGTDLLYQGMVVDTLSLRYYAKPTALATDDLTPLAVPENFHMSVIVPYIVKECFNMIEDGIEGSKVNTQKWEELYMIGKAKLAAFVKPTQPREPKYVEDLW